MHKFLLRVLLLFPVVLVSPCLTWRSAIAKEVDPVSRASRPSPSASEVKLASADKLPTRSINSAPSIVPSPAPSIALAAPTPSITETPSVPVVLPEEENNDPSDDPMSQVTSVSQLGDVKPTDWAFQALQSLVERYGCIAGYPDRTYRGNRALTRYEFAAGLNACLNRVNELIAAATSDLVRKEDIATAQRLQAEFGPELTALRGRVDILEARTAQVEANQFSTTTKLNGDVWINFTTAKSSGGSVRLEGTQSSVNDPLAASLALRNAGRDPVTNRPLVQKVGNPNPTLSEFVWLNLNTSFTGKDALVLQLASGNGNSPANQFASAGQYNTFGVPFFDQTAGIVNGVSDVIVRELFYSFPITSQVQAVVGPRVNWYRYFDNNRFTFIFTGASSFNSSGSTLLNSIDRGSGAAILIKPSKQLQLNLAYLGENTEYLPAGLFNSSSNPTQGLFGGSYTATAELTFSPINTFNLRLLYDRGRHQQIFGTIGGATGEPLYGTADDSQGGPLKSATSDTYEANFDWLVAPKIGVFGRYTYGSTHLTPVNTAIRRGDVNAQAIQAGLAFPDLGKEGALGTFSFVIPFSVLNGRRFLISNVGNGGKEYDFEGTYFYPLTNNIAIVPAFYYIMHPNNFSNNPGVLVGNVRAQFSF